MNDNKTETELRELILEYLRRAVSWRRPICGYTGLKIAKTYETVADDIEKVLNHII